MSFSISYNIIATDQFSKIAENVSDAVDRVKSKVSGFNTYMSSVGSSLKKTGDRMSSAGRTLGFAVTAPLVGAITAYDKFEDGLENVLTLLNRDEINKFKGQLDDTQTSAVRLGFSVEDASTALFDTVSALGMNNQAMLTFKESQKLAIGGVTSLAIASDGLTSVINTYGKETTKASDVANAFFSAQKYGKTTVESLAQNVGKIAPIAKQAGVGFKELLAAMSQLTLGGLSTEEATTSLKGVLTTLIKPGKDSIRIFEAIEKKFKIKIPFGTTEIKAKGLGYTLLQLSRAADKAPDALARMIPNIRALTGVGALGTEQLKNMDMIINAINSDIENGTGLNDAYALKMSGIGQTASMVWGDLKVLSKEIVSYLAPGIEAILGGVKFLINLFIGLPSPIKKVISYFVGLVAVIGPVLIIFGTAIKVLGILSTYWVTLSASFSSGLGLIGTVISAVKFIGIGLAAITGLPIWGIAVIVAALATGTVLLVTHWDSFIDKLIAAWSWLEKIWNRFKVFTGFGKGEVAAMSAVNTSIQEKRGENMWQRGPISEKTKEQTLKNLLEGTLNINIRDKGSNVQSITSTSSGPLNLGVYGLAQ